VCQTQTPLSQTTTVALSVGRLCTYTHVRNKHQCCYLSVFTLLSLFWNEKKNVGHYFLSNLRKCKLILDMNIMRKIKLFFKPYGATCNFKFKTKELYIVFAHCTYVRVLYILRTHSDYFPLQHSPRGLSNGNELC